MAEKIGQQILGSGEVYFDPFDADTLTGQGEIYLGNTPDFVTTRTPQALDRADSYDGQKVPVEGLILQEDHILRFTTDDGDAENVGFWFGGTPALGVDPIDTNLSETIVVKRNRYYQLGVSVDRPVGLRGLSAFSILRGALPIVALGNYDIDLPRGRLYINADALDIQNADELTINYFAPTLNTSVITSQRRQLFGSLRFVSYNSVGPQRNYFYPLVKLGPDGDAPLKGDAWSTWSFSAQAFRKSPLVEYVYVEENLPADLGPITGDFPYYEDILNTLINFTMPSRGY